MTGTAAIWSSSASLIGSGQDAVFLSLTRALFDYLREVLTLVARGFQHEAARISADKQDARYAVFSSLIEGSDPSHVAARSEVPLASRYLVLAIDLGRSTNPQKDSRSPSVERLRRLNETHRVLGEFAAGDVLSLIRDPRGTALVPLDAGNLPEADRLADLAERLATAVGADIHVGAVVAAVEEIPTALVQAEEILELVIAIGFPAGVWLLDDILIPYQLTRPGHARDALVRKLRILDDHIH